ncbi:GNAT family N-acetyltransferase [Streptantibioticus parmotrematis]|uniref:GNAT family N-acetyltransferase n=1 Tax=Streptantibioticus parmotrematis TaxID=2873249 RepID=UPI0033C2E04C
MSDDDYGDYQVRPVRVDEWPALKELRLTALQDPLASIAFLQTYDDAVARPDAFWKERTAGAAEGGPNRQFVAETPDGGLAGMVTVLVEEPGTVDFAGERVERRQGHLVGVFVRQEHRGTTVARALFRAALDWTRERGDLARVRLMVHRDNARAEAFYRKAGFTRTRPLGDEYEMEHRTTP